MNIRQAILKTADLFDTSPEMYNFMNTSIPSDCGSPGCVVGHVAAFMEVSEDSIYGVECAEALGTTYHVFFNRMCSLTRHCRGTFTRNANVAAIGLRLYADKYHPVSTPQESVIPESILSLFKERVLQ